MLKAKVRARMNILPPEWILFFQTRKVANANPDIKTELRDGEMYWALLFAKCKRDKKTEPRTRVLLLENTGQIDSLEAFRRVEVFTVSEDSDMDRHNAIGVWEILEKSTIIIV